MYCSLYMWLIIDRVPNCCRPMVEVFIHVLDLLEAVGQNPHIGRGDHTVIKKIWQKSHPQSFDFATKQFGRRSKQQPYSQHDAQGIAESVYALTGKSKAQHLARADQLKVTRRADLVIQEVDALHKLIANLSLAENHARALSDDIRSLYQREHGKYNKPQSIEVFKLVAQHPDFWPDACTQGLNAAQQGFQAEAQSKQPAELVRDFAMDSPNTTCDIRLCVSGTPDFRWESGVVKLKNRMYAEEDMLDKWREGDHAESCLYHILSTIHPTWGQAPYRSTLFFKLFCASRSCPTILLYMASLSICAPSHSAMPCYLLVGLVR